MGDGVKFQTLEYKAHKNQVALCKAIYHGIDTAKDLIYPSPNEYKKDYETRQELATLNNFVERTVTTMAGQIFRVPISFKDMPTSLEAKTKTINGKRDLNALAKNLCKSGILSGKAYALADLPINGGNVYVSIIERDQLINYEKDANENFTFAVIHEFVTKKVSRFESELIEQYRVYDATGNIELWRKGTDTKNGSAGEFELKEKIVTSYSFIPLYELNIDDVPPLYDIAKINANHLNASSRKDSYLDVAGSPIPFAKGLGVDAEEQLNGEGDAPAPVMVLGVKSIIFTDNPEASMEWVEMTGQNIEALQDDLERKERSMAERALKVITQSVKTATQVEQEASESNSRLSDIAQDIEIVLTSLLNGISMMLFNSAFDGQVIANRDFKTVAYDGQTITALNALVLAGNLSRETLLTSLVKGEVIEVDSVEDEVKKIEDENLGIKNDDRV